MRRKGADRRMPSDYTVYYLQNGGRRETEQLLPLAAARYAGGGGWQLARTERGKPYFPQAPGVQVSVTHSGSYWMCAIGRSPVGLDLQEHREAGAERISKRFFHPAEDAFLRAGEYRRFFDVWAAKESYVKFTGEGLQAGMNRFAVASADGLLDCVNGARLRLLPFMEGYSLCICAAELDAVRFEALDGSPIP